jgi:hypothetical protein
MRREERLVMNFSPAIRQISNDPQRMVCADAVQNLVHLLPCRDVA